MALQTDLEREAKNIFSAYSSASLPLPSNKGNLYELYIFLLAFDTIHGLNPAATIKSPTTGFTFRCSPGKIENNKFSFAEFDRNGVTYQLRNGIEVTGHNMYHEIDVGIYEGTQTNKSRPGRSILKLSIECKNHARLSSIKGESRKYLGCITDLTHATHGTAGCIVCGIGFDASFATPLIVTSSNRYYKYLQSYTLNPMFDLAPGTSCESAFKRYITSVYHSL